MRNAEEAIIRILTTRGPISKQELVDLVQAETGVPKYQINNCWLSLKYAKKVGYVKGIAGLVEMKATAPDPKFQVCGVQFPPEDAMTKDIFDQLYHQFDGYYFDFLRIDGEHASAYFMIKQEVYERWEIDGRLSDFETYIREILDDMDLEHENGLYEFDGVAFSFTYA